MRRKLMYVLISCCCLQFASAQDSAKTWKLIWQDEFNYKGFPDSAKWNYDIGGDGWGNNELQYYTSKRKENARVENGNLIIEARKEKFENQDYTSARLVTKGKGDWKYGKIEVRAKLSKGRGTWPAIWMLSSKMPFEWPDDGEIDIMEHVGFNQGFIHGSLHSKKYNHIIGTQKTDTVFVNDCSETYHVYGLEWTADSIKISVDHTVFFSTAKNNEAYAGWPFDQPFHLILNQAVGGNWGGAKGVNEKIWPQKMWVDYVRVYQ